MVLAKKDLKKTQKLRLKMLLLAKVSIIYTLLYLLHLPLQDLDGECFVDNYDRVLSGFKLVNDSMTIEKCKQFCASNEFLFCGVQSSNDCFCGNEVPKVTAPSRECHLPCSGNGSQKCGGHWRLNVYSISPTTRTSTTTTTSTTTSSINTLTTLTTVCMCSFILLLAF